MAKVQKSEFTTNPLAPDARFETWRESIGCLFDVERRSVSTEKEFDASLTSYLLDSQVMLSRCKTNAQRFSRNSLRSAQDGLDYYLIQTHVSGAQEIRRGRKWNSFSQNELMIIDLAEVYDAQTTDFDNLTMVVPRHLLAPLLNQPESQQGRVLNGQNPLAALVIAHLQTLAVVADGLDESEAAAVLSPTFSLIAAALNGGTDSVEHGAAGVARSLLARAKIHIERNLYRHDISVVTLCRDLAVSRAGLYRLFEPYGGVRTYMQERRLRRAAVVLQSKAAHQRPIYDIAFSCGFASEAHFSRAFKRRFGVSPRHARMSGSPVTSNNGPLLADDNGDRNYENWVNEILRT